VSSQQVRAILGEIEARLETLLDSGAADPIDVHRLPLTARERQALAASLGDGEVAATVTALVRTAIRETGRAGVWWVVQREPEGERVVAEWLGISLCPDLLTVDADDVRAAVARRRTEAADDLPED